MKKKAIILGVNGGFGSLLSGLLLKEGLLVTGVDLAGQPDQSASCSGYICSDVTLFTGVLAAALKESEIVIICLPEEACYQFFKTYDQYISKSALLIDTLSVKREVASIYVKNDFNAISLNPMFGPDLSMAGKNIVAIEFHQSPASEWFMVLLKTWGLNLVYMTSEEHDQMSAFIQVATHAAAMAFGSTIASAHFSMTQLLRVATPPFLSLSAVFGRIASGNKKVYWNIQRDNVYASAVRKDLIKNLIALDQSIDQGSEEEFSRLIGAKAQDQKEIFKNLADNFASQSKNWTYNSQAE